MFNVRAIKENDISLMVIEESPNFYHEKAVMAWNAWKELLIDNEVIEDLYAVNYQSFLDNNEANVIKIRDCLFTFVAYCDYHAKEKKTRNAYPDYRTIALTAIRQNIWVRDLLQYKLNKDNVLESIQNIIDYVEEPNEYFPIVSEIHKQLIYEYYIGEPYNKTLFAKKILYKFSEYIENVSCEMNKSAYLTRLIYSQIDLWNNSDIEGLFVHETNDDWKEKLISEIGDGYACVWWSDLPTPNYREEVLGCLFNKLSEGQSFSLYYLKSNKAVYRAVVEDFSLEENYVQKYQEWTEKSPIWSESDFSCYEDGRQNAKIVFLISRFECLDKDIDLECFQLYKGMKDRPLKGIMAYSKILSREENEYVETFDKQVQNSIELLELNKNLILQGAPGTGKTYLTSFIAEAIVGEGEPYDYLVESGQIAFTTFHQSMDYEDFVEGLRPELKGEGVIYTIKDGLFKELCLKAKQNKNKKFVLIIDEINRGNISKIFGELITLIEADKRSNAKSVLSAKLTYSQEKFCVPNNLYIIGTMNTTDRSVGTIDYALRRRFVFKTLESDINVLSLLNSDLALQAKALFNAIKNLVEKYNSGDFEFEDLMVGHSYFFAKDLKGLKQNLEYKIIPLLKEYAKDGVLTQFNNEDVAELKLVLDL